MTDEVEAAPGPRRKPVLIAGGIAASAIVAAVAGYFAWDHFKPRTPGAPARPAAVAPVAAPAAELDAEELTPFNVRALTFDEAIAYNKTLPVSTLPNPPAPKFVFGSEDVLDRNNATDCLTAALYYEARTEPVDGQRAVAQVVLNRVRHPAYPKTVCGVVFQGSERLSGCQFSFTCDGALVAAPDPKQWERLKALAVKALDGEVYAPVGMSTHYHAGYVVPYWADSLVKVSEIGLHIFYRWTGGWGLPPAFTGVRTGVEVLPLSLQSYSTTYLEAIAAAEAAALAAAAAPPPEIVIAGSLPPAMSTPAPGHAAGAPSDPSHALPSGGVAAPEQAPTPQAEPPRSQWFGGPRRNGPRLPVPGS